MVEEGHYWAIWAGMDKWEPVKIERTGFGKHQVFAVGVRTSFALEALAHLGPRLEPPAPRDI
jgi:hypothetical protein